MAQARYFSSASLPTTLSAELTTNATTMSVASVTGLPSSYPYTMLINWGTSNQEVVTVTQAPTGTGPYSFASILRGEDGTTAKTHASGSPIAHGVSAREYNDALTHLGNRLEHVYSCANGTEQATYEDLDITGLTIKRTDTYEVKTWTGSAWKIVGGLDKVAYTSGTQLTQGTTTGYVTNANSLSGTVRVPSSGKLAVTFGGRPYANTGASFSFTVGLALSGGNTVAATDAQSFRFYASSAGYYMPQDSCTAVFSGLTEGSTTMTMQYNVASGTCTMYTQWMIARGLP